MNIYRRLADIVSWFHAFWLLLLLGGSLIALIFPWYKTINWIVISVTLVSQILWLGCPLTVLEHSLRNKYNPADKSSGSFVCNFCENKLGIKISPIVVFCQLVMLLAISSFICIQTR